MATKCSQILLFGFLTTTAIGLGISKFNKKIGLGVAAAGAVFSVLNLLYLLYSKQTMRAANYGEQKSARDDLGLTAVNSWNDDALGPRDSMWLRPEDGDNWQSANAAHSQADHKQSVFTYGAGVFSNLFRRRVQKEQHPPVYGDL